MKNQRNERYENSNFFENKDAPFSEHLKDLPSDEKILLLQFRLMSEEEKEIFLQKLCELAKETYKNQTIKDPL